MSTAQRNACLQEALDQGYLFRAVAHLRNGLGSVPPRNVIQPEAAVAAAAVDAPPAAVIEPRAETHAPTRRGVMRSALLGAAGASAVAIAGWVGSRMAQPPAPAPVSPTVIVAEEGEPPAGDLLWYLRQNGYHLPPRGAKP